MVEVDFNKSQGVPNPQVTEKSNTLHSYLIEFEGSLECIGFHPSLFGEQKERIGFHDLHDLAFLIVEVSQCFDSMVLNGCEIVGLGSF